VTAPGSALLRARGAADVPHPGGTLDAHLGRVADLLARFGASEVARAAGACHAAYGTDGFPRALLALDERHRLRDAIGPAAEGLVYRYCSCDRAATHHCLGADPVPFADRFTGETVPVVREELRDFAVLTVANEVDVTAHAGLLPADRRALRALTRSVADLLPDAARIAADRAFAG
jgi:hypothetical protein